MLHEIEPQVRKMRPQEEPPVDSSYSTSDLVTMPSLNYDMAQMQVHDFDWLDAPPIFEIPDLDFTSFASFEPTIISNPNLSVEDSDDPFAFALSAVSPDDMNMKL